MLYNRTEHSQVSSPEEPGLIVANEKNVPFPNEITKQRAQNLL